jgi:hypothetical protein
VFSYRWRPSDGLGTVVLRALDESLFHTDHALRPRPPLDVADASLFPDPAVEPTWTSERRLAVAAQLDALNGVDPDPVVAMPAYRALPDDAVRILAGLPGNERAFVQVTTGALDAGDPACADRRGPDDAGGYVPDPTLRVFTDVLDARTPARYLYRALYADAAHNRGPLSIASPVVQVCDALAPHAPVIKNATCADGVVTIRFTQPDSERVALYRVYRTRSETSSADVALMGTPFEPTPDLLERDADILLFEDGTIADGGRY